MENLRTGPMCRDISLNLSVVFMNEELFSQSFHCNFLELLDFSGWHVKGIIKNPTPKPEKPRKRKKASKKSSQAKGIHLSYQLS